MSVMALPWPWAGLSPFSDINVNVAQRLLRLHSGNNPGSGKHLPGSSEKDTGGERQVQNPVTNQGENVKTGRN